MFDIRKLIRSTCHHLDTASLLRQPIDILMGVSPAAKTELDTHNIKTVFDLAASSLFREAAMLVAAADNPSSEWALAGTAPRTVVDSAIAALPIQIIAERNVEDLRSFSEKAAGRLSAALDVTTIRDLAAWPPYLAALQIFQELNGKSESGDVWDPGTPPELVPTMGRHPTERAYYQTILLERFLEPPPAATAHRVAVPLEAAGQVDIASQLLNSPGFDRVAIGALVQFSQSWYTSGLSLGQLLHSLALAPGESTRIAMIDWQRRERGTRTEDTQEHDQLTSELAHNRALNEVVDAVAREVQTGASASQTSGESWGFGKSGGGGGSIGGDEGQSYGFGGGYSLGYGTGKSQASSWGVSTGNRNLRAELTQNIQDLTHQASTMARNRWATTVQEVSQQEHEQLSTRAVTNYNHMHALTVQYYEVIQIYRVAIDIDRITRCLFVPMQVIDFRRRDVVSRFRNVLAAAALIPQMRATLSAAEKMILSLPSPGMTWDMSQLATKFGKQAWVPGEREAAVQEDPWSCIEVGIGQTGHPFVELGVEYHDGTVGMQSIHAGDPRLPFLSRQLLESARLAPSMIRRLVLKRQSSLGIFAPTPPGSSFRGTVRVMVAFLGKNEYGVRDDASSPQVLCVIDVPVEPGTDDIPLLELHRGIDYSEIADHLRENALYYSQAIWRSLDPAAISLALAGYSFSGKPLMEAIDPTPVAVAGNYLVFRTYATDEEWDAFLDSKKLYIGPVSSTVVPLPSGGVFAEAVLGRANSAEKLDMTRFWNWQDSPIPIAAPEIAALQAVSRNQQMNLDTGKLSPSVLNIMNPTQLPDPTGMTAALTALAQGTMFRDMSGLAATIGLAGTSLQEAFKGSSDAQKYAMENFKTAASLVGKANAKPSTVTENGAKTVQAQNMDARERQNPGSVGPSEKKAFESSLSPPPLVEAKPQGSSPNEWAQWPGTNANGPESGNTGTGRGTAEGIPAGRLVSSSDAGVAPAIDVSRLTTAVMTAINGDARLKESLDQLLSDGWDIRRTNIYWGNSSVDSTNKVIYIDDDDEPLTTIVEWAANSVRKAYQDNDDYRRTAVREKAMAIFGTPGGTDLEKMAKIYDWAGWFWRYPTDLGNARGLMNDMVLILTNIDTDGLSLNDKKYYIFARGRIIDVNSTGFKYAFRDDSNQVRHATAAIHASLKSGPIGEIYAQAREDWDSADHRLNSRCATIGHNMWVQHSPVMPKNIGACLRRELGDPTQTAPWTGPADGDPNVPPPW